MPRGPRKPVGSYFGTILKTFSDVFSGHSFQRMHREKLKESEREAPTSNGRARARSARARAHPRLSRLAGLQLGMLWLLLRSCCSRCLCSCSSSSPLLFRLLLRLQCLMLSRLSRFPFHDSQVSFFGCFFDANFRSPLGPILETKMLPKWLQNWSQEAPKTLLEQGWCSKLLSATFFVDFRPPGT